MSAPDVSPSQAAIVARELFLLLHPAERTWFERIWDSCAKAPSPVECGGSWTAPSGLGASAEESPASRRLAEDFAVMATTFLLQSPMARSELLKRLEEACAKRGYAKTVRDWVAQVAGQILDSQASNTEHTARTLDNSYASESPADYLVWNHATNDVVSAGPEKCTTAEINLRCWERRSEYDLLIYKGLVFAPKAAGDHEIELKASDFRLLVAMLVHKPQALAPTRLYLFAWQQSGLTQGNAESDILTKYLKPAMTRLRTQVKPLIQGMDIPDKRTVRGYAIKGAFSFCVSLSVFDAGPYLAL
jgi:hypothetical protein